MTYLHVDLCCGLGGWQAPFRESDQWQTVGVDIREEVGPDILADVQALPIDTDPTLVTASPPCQDFSTAPRLPFFMREQDFSVWNGSVRAILDLDPQWFVIENVKGMVYFHGEPQKRVGPYYLWGHFPPFDVAAPPQKSDRLGRVADTAGAATIPFSLADALRQAVELYL